MMNSCSNKEKNEDHGINIPVTSTQTRNARNQKKRSFLGNCFIAAFRKNVKKKPVIF